MGGHPIHGAEAIGGILIQGAMSKHGDPMLGMLTTSMIRMLTTGMVSMMMIGATMRAGTKKLWVGMVIGAMIPT